MKVDEAISLREATQADVDSLARIRSAEWGSQAYWHERISGYMEGRLHPGESLLPRVVFVAENAHDIIGFIAGHLTRRFGCDGELQWLNVAADGRRSGLAARLLRRLAMWFDDQGAKRICVDVDPGNIRARTFYQKHGAEELNPHWLVWRDMLSVGVTRSSNSR